MLQGEAGAARFNSPHLQLDLIRERLNRFVFGGCFGGVLFDRCYSFESAFLVCIAFRYGDDLVIRGYQFESEFSGFILGDFEFGTHIVPPFPYRHLPHGVLKTLVLATSDSAKLMLSLFGIGNYSVVSMIPAMRAFSLTDSMPFITPSFSL